MRGPSSPAVASRVDHGDIEEHQPFLARDREHGRLERNYISNNKQYENNYEVAKILRIRRIMEFFSYLR